MKQYNLNSFADNDSMAEDVARSLCPGDIILLSGPIGAGKTTFVRSLIRRLQDANTEVPSPSFNLLYEYETGLGKVRHFDLYRLKHPAEAEETRGVKLAEQKQVALVPLREIVLFLFSSRFSNILVTTIEACQSPFAIDNSMFACPGRMSFRINFKLQNIPFLAPG